MPARRIIPCLDVKDGRVVKGVRFRDHRDVGDIVENAARYADEGADELVFYDITASAEGRSVDRAWIRRVAAVIDIPFAVAGGIRTVDEAAACLDAGADKISINSPASNAPTLSTNSPAPSERSASSSASTACAPRAATPSSNIPARKAPRAMRAASPSIGCAKPPRAARARSSSIA
jgi:imidazoleglycerol phosphate synthase cyclase subunit